MTGSDHSLKREYVTDVGKELTGTPAADQGDGSNRKPVADGENRSNRKSVADQENRVKREKATEGKGSAVNGKSGKRERTVVLSGRMRMLADMVTAGNCVADVGCDHAFLSIYLVQTGKCPKCLAMDVRKGPLSGAVEHIASHGLEEYIETRLSDGLSAYHRGEAQTLICAGMGGRLMEKILTEGGEKTRAFSELILQPQSEIPEFRVFLRKAGFLITEEEAIYEDGKYYFAMRAVYRGRNLSADQTPIWGSKDDELTEYEVSGRREEMRDELYDLYGKQLLLGKHPVLRQYLLKRKRTMEELITQLERKGSQKSGTRKEELFLELKHLERALLLLQADEQRG